MATWIIRSKTSPARRRKICFPCLQTEEGWCTIQSRHQHLMLERHYAHVMEKLLVWVVFSPLSSGSWMAAGMPSPLALLGGPNRS